MTDHYHVSRKKCSVGSWPCWVLECFSQCCLMNDVVHNTKNDLVPGMFLADVWLMIQKFGSYTRTTHVIFNFLQWFKNQAFHKTSKYHQFDVKSSYKSRTTCYILRRVQEPSIPQDQQIQSVLHQKQLEVKNHMLHLQEFKNQAVHKSSKYNQFYAWSSYRSQEPHVTLTKVQEPSIPHVIFKFLRCWRTKHSTRITTSHRKTSNSSWKLTPRGAVEASNNVLMKNNVSTPDPQNWLTTCWLSMPGGLWVFRKSRLSQL